MRHSLLIVVIVLLLLPSASFAISTSIANGYGSASHADDLPAEWFGMDASSFDGLMIGNMTQGASATISMSVTLDNFFDAGSYEWISIWADWNQDFVFGDDELIFGLNDHWFENGTTNFAFNLDVPLTAQLGSTWLRARISADGPLSATGDLFTGEVEEYQLAVNSSGTAAVPEPGTLALFGFGLAGAAVVRRARSK